MRKTLGGIKHHWRPVYKSIASGETSSTTLQTVLNLTATKRGKVAIRSGSASYASYKKHQIEVQVDGVTFVFHYETVASTYRGDFDFNNSCRIRHRVVPGETGVIRTDVSYWVI